MESLQSRLVCRFVQEPPRSHRKSNFFCFQLALAADHHPLRLVAARFLAFVSDGHSIEDRNGVRYTIQFSPLAGPLAGQHMTRHLVVWVIDSVTEEIVQYQGSLDNPRHARVLLTHETGCMRCIGRKSCGSQIDSPADPTIVEPNTLRFKLRCNQNCLLAAGLPKNKNRKFRILITEGESPLEAKYRAVAKSREMFIHNSSKLGKKKGLPRVTCLAPKSGYQGSTLLLVGEHLERGAQILLDETPLHTQVEGAGVLSASVPDMGCNPRPLSVSVRTKDHLVECDTPFYYVHRPIHECLGRACAFCKWESSEQPYLPPDPHFQQFWLSPPTSPEQGTPSTGHFVNLPYGYQEPPYREVPPHHNRDL